MSYNTILNIRNIQERGKTDSVMAPGKSTQTQSQHTWKEHSKMKTAACGKGLKPITAMSQSLL